MNTSLSSFHRFHVVSFVLAGICFAAMALLCQSAVMGQTNAIPYDNGVSIQNDAGESGFSNEGSSGASKQGTKKKSGKWKLWLWGIVWGIVIFFIYRIGGRPLLVFINIISGGKLKEQNPSAYNECMNMPDPPVQITIPEPQTPPPSPTPKTTPQDASSVNDTDSTNETSKDDQQDSSEGNR